MNQGERKVFEKAIKTKKLAIAAALLIASVSFIEVAAKPSTRVELFRTCTKKNGAYIGYFVFNGTVHKSKNIGLIEGEARILSNLKPPLPAELSVLRCRNSAGKECVPLLKYKHNNICPFLVSGSANTLWKGFTDKFEPTLKCPTGEKILHKVLNGTFDGEKFSAYFQGIPGEQAKVTYFVIKVHSKVNDEDKLCIEITFRQVRS